MIDLVKGQKVNLSKDNPDLKQLYVGLGWDPGKGLVSVDCDSGVFLLQHGKLKSNEDRVYFAHLRHNSGAVVHHGDNLTGQGDGDDEGITIYLDRVPEEYDKLVVFINIFAAKIKFQHFGKIDNAFARLVNADTNEELYRYTLGKDYDKKTGILFVEIYRKDGCWKVNALGEGVSKGSIDQLSDLYK